MQKLLKRTAQAQRQAGRRAKKINRRDEFDTRRRNNQYLKMANDEIRQNLKDSRRARKEDWEMGPLAPKRDLGFNGYGTFRENLRQDWTNNGMNPIDPKVLEQRCAWAGGVKQLCLAPQDRVVILEGPDKGKVDRIQSVNKLNGSVTLENHHKVSRYAEFPAGLELSLTYSRPSFKPGLTASIMPRQCQYQLVPFVWYTQSPTPRPELPRIR